MNRYQKVFTALQQKNQAAFIPFAIAGDPDADRCETILQAYIAGGADILEIGYPFSDPIADGPVNQRSAQRAIAAGMNLPRFFKMISAIRTSSTIPIGLLLYANTVHHLGYRTFCTQATEAGIDSLLIADLPPEEYDDVGREMKRTGLQRVFIVSELTPPARMIYITRQVDAFVYVVSRLGTTGTDSTLSSSVAQTLGELKKVTKKPLAVGFGISTPEHVRAVIDAGADAAIVGSALVKTIEAKGDDNQLPELLKHQVATYKAATLKR